MMATRAPTSTDILARRGLRKSRLRRGLLPLLTKHPLPLDAPAILSLLRREGVVVNKTSLYRELTLLMEQHIVQATDFGDGKQRFELVKDHHHHLICTNCGRVEDLPLAGDLDIVERSLIRRRDFFTTSHRLEFFGLCKNCHSFRTP